jgi:hypothetical protein
VPITKWNECAGKKIEFAAMTKINLPENNLSRVGYDTAFQLNIKSDYSFKVSFRRPIRSRKMRKNFDRSFSLTLLINVERFIKP